MLRDLEKSDFTYNPHRGINIDRFGFEDKKIYQLIDLNDTLNLDHFSIYFNNFLEILDKSIIFNTIEYVKNDSFEKIISMPISLKNKQVIDYIEMISKIANLKSEDKNLIYLLSTIKINNYLNYEKSSVYGSSFTYAEDKLIKTTFYFKLRKSSLMDDNYEYDNIHFLDKLYSFNIQDLNSILDDLRDGLLNNFYYLRLLGVDFYNDGKVYFKVYVESKCWDDFLSYITGLNDIQRENFQDILIELEKSNLYLDLVSVVNKVDSKNLNLYFLKKV